MKHLIVLSLLALSVIVSCTTAKTECTNYRYYYLMFHRSSNDTITDTAVWLAAYKKESNFTQLRDSVHYDIWRNQSIQGSNVKMIDLPLKGANDSFDWKFICYPSGKTFTMTKIANHQRSTQQVKYRDHDCSNDLSFMFNDSMYLFSGTEGASSLAGSMWVKYD